MSPHCQRPPAATTTCAKARVHGSCLRNAGFVPTALAVVSCFALETAAQEAAWENANGQLGALSRANLAKEHPPHPMNLTGTYTPEGFWEFQPYPKLKPAAQELFDRVRAGAAEEHWA